MAINYNIHQYPPVNWRNSDAINRGATYPKPFTPPNMLDVSGEVGEYGQRPGEGYNEDMYTEKGNDGFFSFLKNVPNFPSIFGTVKGGLEWLGDKFQRSPEKQAEWDALRDVTDQYGTYRGGTLPTGESAQIVDNKISVRAPDGTMLLRDKNFDSLLGSNSVADMLQDKEDWAKGRFEKYGDEWTDDKHKGISRSLYNYYKNTGVLDDWRGKDIQSSGTVDGRTDSGIVPEGYRDRQQIEAFTGRPMSDYRASRPSSERQFTGQAPRGTTQFDTRSGMGRRDFYEGGIVQLYR